ncbi:MAG: MarR family transcriptional regulator [Jatrophihabitans sp.]|nr:MAG: MarR family transcriptional regulator [Jatrophihabitans sp.]
MSPARTFSDRDYARLLAVRSRLRRFEHWSAAQAADEGLTASQHQLMLAVRGHDDAAGPTIGEVAEYLMVKHNTAVGLVDRTAEAGLLERVRDASDHRIVRLRLTVVGARRLAALSAAHLEELSRLTPLFEALLTDLRAT